MTNGDKIRSMTNEELAAVLQCPHDEVIHCIHIADDVNCSECIKEWLESEGEE